VQGIRYITKLNHLGHATSILSCHSHVNKIAFAQAGSVIKVDPNISGCAGYDFLQCANCVRELRYRGKSTDHVND
jgi:hypothetical protein